MRKEYFELLYELMCKNKKIIAITADLGYIGFDKIMQIFPKRYINVGASEQSMMDVAVGMAYDGYIPFTYTITPFYFRAFETIRTYINHEKLNVKMIASGRDNDYAHDGFSHFAGDDKSFFTLFTNIECIWPKTIENMKTKVKDISETTTPVYLNLSR